MKLLIPLLLTLMSGCLGNSKPAPTPTPGSAMSGEASYYGGKFHGRTTASGEVYNKDALTAAHKTLPFNTRVRVTNRETGRSVVVRINDRFPGTKGRIIDLSEASFEKIAPLARGVIPVELQIVN